MRILYDPVESDLASYHMTYIWGVPWHKAVSIVDWGYGKKIDFRKWAADYSVCGKGVAVSFHEAEEIFDVIREL